MPSDLPQPDFARGKLAEVDQGMPDELRAQFRSLVEDLHWHAHRRGWHPIRQYPVLADLIRGGWRGPEPSPEAMGGEA